MGPGAAGAGQGRPAGPGGPPVNVGGTTKCDCVMLSSRCVEGTGAFVFVFPQNENERCFARRDCVSTLYSQMRLRERIKPMR